MPFRPLADNRPGAVGLLAGAAGSRLRTPVDKDFLAIIRASETGGIVSVVDNVERPGVAVARIAPLIGAVGTAGIESVVIGLVGVAAIFAIEIAGQGGTGYAAENHTGDSRTTIPTAHGIAEQAADKRARDNAGRIRGLLALLVEGVVVVAIGASITLTPALALFVIPVVGVVAVTVTVIGVVKPAPIAGGLVPGAITGAVGVVGSVCWAALILARRPAVLILAPLIAVLSRRRLSGKSAYCRRRNDSSRTGNGLVHHCFSPTSS